VTNDNFVASVIGPNGGVLTEADLPPRNTARWVPRRKAEIIAAVNGGLLSLLDACQRYRISPEEFRDWVCAYEQSGLSGLRARRKRREREVDSAIDAHSLM
jgi:transposase-like protein